MTVASISEIFGGHHFDPATDSPHTPNWTAEFLSSALEGAGMGTWQLDMHTGLITWDAVTSSLLGLEKIALTTDALLPVHQDDQLALRSSLQHSKDTGEPHDMIFRGLHSDGSIRWLHALGRPLPAEGVSPRYIAGTVSDVTDRKLAELARMESERQLTSIVNNLPGIAYRCETQEPWRISFVSDAVGELTGYPKADFLSNKVNWESLIVAEDRQAVSDQIAQAIADRSQFQLRYRICRPSGEVRWVQERGTAVYSDEGDPLFLEGFVGDIHEQAIAKQELLDTAERLRLAAQATQDVIWDWDLVRNTISRSAAVGKILGYDSEEFGQRLGWWRSRVHPDDLDQVSTKINQVVNGEIDRFDAEFRFRKKGGSYADILDRGYLIRDESGKPVRMVGAGLVNTERNASTRALREREAHLSTVFAQAMVGIVHRSFSGELIMANERYCEIVGRTEDELRALKVADFTHPEDQDRNDAAQYEGAKRGESVNTQKRYVRPDGSLVWCEVSTTFVEASDGQEGSFITIAQDFSARRSAEKALKESELLYRSILEASADCIKIINLDGELELMNAQGLCAMEIENFEAVRGAVWVDFWPSENRATVEAAVTDAKAGKTARFNAFCPTALGTPKWWDVVVSPMLDEEGGVCKILSIARDITIERSAAAELKWASEHDVLTGLANRRGFEAHLQAATIRAMHGDTKVGLLLLDLDHFKHINDTLGHAAGDHLLGVFGKRIRECVRGGDFVARLGGDEFAVILEGGDQELDLLSAGDSILARFREPITFDGRVMGAGVSIGGALFPANAMSASELFNNADTALYALKAGGRGGIIMFHQHMREQAQLVSSQLSLARSAITRESVEPHYQQKIDLETGKIAGFEALLRWRHVTQGIQLPETVAEAFKDYELAAKIGDLMQRRVFSDMRAWLDQGLPFGFVAVNAAPVEFLRDDFAERLLAHMQEQAIPPHLVEIEVTEHVFLERGPDFVGRALKMLSRAGVRIALDDFGTGYSSLSHLRDYPVDVVKIDRSFIEKFATDVEARAIVCAVIDLAKSLNIEVVAEGVETEEQNRLLIKNGCEIGQGYLFGRAIEADEVPHLLESPRSRSRMHGGTLS